MKDFLPRAITFELLKWLYPTLSYKETLSSKELLTKGIPLPSGEVIEFQVFEFVIDRGMNQIGHGWIGKNGLCVVVMHDFDTNNSLVMTNEGTPVQVKKSETN